LKENLRLAKLAASRQSAIRRCKLRRSIRRHSSDLKYFNWMWKGAIMRECGRVTGPVGLLLANLILLGGASCQCVTHGAHSSDAEISHVRNFGVVKEGVLYRGAAPDALALNQLRTSKYKIKTIVNLALLDDELISMDAEDLRYFHVPIFPVPYIRTGGNDRQIKRFLEIVNDPANQPVFVHCTRGADRTGEAVGVFEILDEHKPIEEVESELYEHHYCKALYPYIDRHLRELAGASTEPPAEPATQPAP
jgi:hypothetical protein